MIPPMSNAVVSCVTVNSPSLSMPGWVEKHRRAATGPLHAANHLERFRIAPPKGASGLHFDGHRLERLQGVPHEFPRVIITPELAFIG